MIKIVFHIPFIVLCVFSGCSKKESQETLLTPPVAEKIAYPLHSNPNDTRIDNYFWLKESENPKVIEYLEQENHYYNEMMSHTKRLQENLYYEMTGRVPQIDQSVPEKYGNYFYYWKIQEGQQFPSYFRKLNDELEELYLDVNELAKGKPYFSLGSHKVNPQQDILAYTVDDDGSERYTLYFKDLSTSKILEDKIPNIVSDIEWANDNRTLFYTKDDEARRPYQVYKHVLGTDTKEDQLVYQENDPIYRLSIGKTKDHRFLVIDTRSILTSESHILDANYPERDFTLFKKRQQGVEYSLEHRGDQFILLTNAQGAKNFKIMTVPDNSISNEWNDLIAYKPETYIEDMEVFKDYLVLFQIEQANPQILIHHFDTHQNTSIPFKPKLQSSDRSGNEEQNSRFWHHEEAKLEQSLVTRDGKKIDFDSKVSDRLIGSNLGFNEPAYNLVKESNLEFDTPSFRFGYTSLITPYSVYEYNTDFGTSELKKRKQVRHYDPSLYRSERLEAISYDGTHIPISMVYKIDPSITGERPLLLVGYGAYGVCYSPDFSSERVSLLDRGVVFVITHIRGGCEKGKQWYEDGKHLLKKNTFLDFIASAEFLIKNGYTSSDKLIIEGRSAGGLLIGAVLNMRPELFHAAIAGVPFVDVVTTMADPNIPLTINEYEEWGNPSNNIDFEYMKSYSPYDNVAAQSYPRLLITGGLHDSRVAYWEPAKWTAKLRATKMDNHILLLKTFMSAGHYGNSGRYEILKEKAADYAFILDQLNLTDNSAKVH